MSGEQKVVAILCLSFFLSGSMALSAYFAFAAPKEHEAEAKIGIECVKNGGQWLRSHIGSRMECVRKAKK